MKRSTQQEYTKRILRVLVFIQKNLDEELSLEEYARVAHFSPYHFHRIFRGMVGESLHEHIRRLRLERAATRLKRTDWAVVEIALEAGYETHEAFTRAFRSLCGCTPSRYRRIRAWFSRPAPAYTTRKCVAGILPAIRGRDALDTTAPSATCNYLWEVK